MGDILTFLELTALLLSLKISMISVIIAMPLALIAAMILARCDFFAKPLFDAIIHLPLIVPPVVIGYLLLLSLGRNGFIGSILYDYFKISIAFTWQGAAIAAAVMAFPLMVRAMRLSIEAVDYKLEDAARTLGSSRLKSFITITLPLILPGIITASILGFARALGEFGATITFVSNIPAVTQTLPLALYSLAQTPGGETGALRLTIISVIVALLALIASEYFARRIKSKQQINNINND